MQHFGTGGGNLAVGDGYLIVAQKDALVVFAQNSRLIDRYRQEIAQGPRPRGPLLPARPGGRGHRPGRAGPGEPGRGPPPRPARRTPIDGLPLGEEAAGQAIQAADPPGQQGRGGRRLAGRGRAVRGGRRRPPGPTATAWRPGSTWPRRRPRRATRPRPWTPSRRSWPTTALRSQVVRRTTTRWTVRADLLIADELAKILQDDGRGFTPTYDGRPRPCWTGAAARSRPATWRRSAGPTPRPRSRPRRCWPWARCEEAENKPAEAARAYRAARGLGPADRRPAGQGPAGPGPRRRGAGARPCRPATPWPGPQARYAELRLDDPGGPARSARSSPSGWRGPRSTRWRPTGPSRASPLPLRRLWDGRWPGPSGRSRPRASPRRRLGPGPPGRADRHPPGRPGLRRVGLDGRAGRGARVGRATWPTA